MYKNILKLISKNLENNKTLYTKQWNNTHLIKTKYFIVDDLLPTEIINKIYESFPVNLEIWNRRNSFRERKYTFAKLDTINPIILTITSVFHDKIILNLISDITGIDNLESDPSLYAGGISMMGKGDFLNPHIDNSHDSHRNRYRRVNLLYYITPDWQKDYGGNLELWDENVVNSIEIISKFNRLVVMETNKKSWHSVNPVLTENKRCCISNYYFSQQSPDKTNYYHITSFLGRPGQYLRRFYGRIDNYARQFIAVKLGVSRGKKLARNIKY